MNLKWISAVYHCPGYGLSSFDVSAPVTHNFQARLTNLQYASEKFKKSEQINLLRWKSTCRNYFSTNIYQINIG